MTPTPGPMIPPTPGYSESTTLEMANAPAISAVSIRVSADRRAVRCLRPARPVRAERWPVSAGRPGPAARPRPDQQPGDPGDEVFQVPEQPGFDHHDGQEGRAEHPQPAAPRRRQQRGGRSGHPESAGGKSGIEFVGQGCRPGPAATGERPEQQGRQHDAGRVADDQRDGRPQRTDPPLVQTEADGQHGPDEEVELGFGEGHGTGEQRPDPTLAERRQPELQRGDRRIGLARPVRTACRSGCRSAAAARQWSA